MTDANPLEVRSVLTGYGRKTVLHGVSLSVKPGEIHGLIGLNGAGKTTLIKAIVGLADIAAGEISLYNVPHTDAQARSRLAYLPEQFLPSPYLKGREFVSLSLSYFGIPYVAERAEAMAEQLALDPRVLAQRVTTYSKGMGQKTGLIGTLLTERPFLILDEPMSGLDPRSRIRLKDQLFKYREKGRAIFLSSHILADLDELCDSVSVLHRGRILYEGTPADLRQAQGHKSLERAFLKCIESWDSSQAA